ncbi:MAG: glycosyltransferase [Moorea sp. SIO3C2]|nr:glycosyltransferase [Moorena sp. SIO3C2]
MMDTISPLISVILPVYNRVEFLGQAIESVLGQTYQNWELIIADDASSPDTQAFLGKYQQYDKVHVQFNTHNMGLFPNLNQAIEKSNGEYLLLLCSDDCLLPDCLETALSFLRRYPESGLLLSAFHTITETGEEVDSGSIYYYNQFFNQLIAILQPQESVCLMLQHGSINGNLTGMFFKRNLYKQIGPFKEDSWQIADWEWVYRVARETPIVLSKRPVAKVRSHSQQLSAVNFKNLRNSLEVIEMVKLLLDDPILAKVPSAKKWARHIMQFHLWYAFKFACKGDISQALKLMKEIHQVTGLGSTFLAMLQWLPERWRVYGTSVLPVPPS